jgi:hypothetical protein
MCQPTRYHLISCMLPPHILTAIAQRGNACQRVAALYHLSKDKTFRAFRAGVRASWTPYSRIGGTLST